MFILIKNSILKKFLILHQQQNENKRLLKVVHTRVILCLWLNQNIGSRHVKVGLRHVFGCLKTMTDLKIIKRYDSFVKRLW